MARGCRVDNARVKAHDGCGDIPKARAKRDDLAACDCRRFSVALWKWRKGKEVFDRVLESFEVSHGISPARNILSEETSGHINSYAKHYGHLVWVDREIVDARDGVEIPCLVTTFLGSWSTPCWRLQEGEDERNVGYADKQVHVFIVSFLFFL